MSFPSDNISTPEEILTCAHIAEAKKYHSYFQATPRRKLSYSLGEEFLDELALFLGDKETEIAKLMDIPFTVVQLKVYYTESTKDNQELNSNDDAIEGNSLAPKKKENDATTVFSSGSGLLVTYSNGYYIITARHIILPEIVYEKLPYELSSIVATFVDDQDGEKIICERPNAPNLYKHSVDSNSWSLRSDFAVLRTNFKPEDVLKEKVIKLEALCYDTPAVDDESFVIGFPGYLSKATFDSYYGSGDPDSGMNYNNFLKTFRITEPVIQKLVVTRGTVKGVSDTLCAYDADTAKGMSGGPVFCVKDSKLVPIGIHVGGYPANGVLMNYFVPFVMKELQDHIGEITNFKPENEK